MNLLHTRQVAWISAAGKPGGGWIWHGEERDFYDRIQISSNVDETTDQAGALIEREWEAYLSL